MKITAIRPWLVRVPWDGGGTRVFVFVQVDTDEGLRGWGEVTTYPGPAGNRAITAFIREVGATLVGKDPTRIEALWHETFRSLTYVGTRGATSAAISGIDIALWDIRGKQLGLPIYELLGGPVRDRVPLYTHPVEPRDPQTAAAAALEIKQSGHRALKMDPMMHSLPGGNAAYLDGEISQQGEARALEILAAVREAVGPGFEILIDAHGKFNVPTAVRLANKMAAYDILWFEEPVPVESWKALQQVRQQVDTRICVGERLFTRWEFVPVFENGLADYVMPDVTWTGGITELKKIATMAEAYYVPLSPHDASGPVNIMAGAQVSLTVPNFYKLETSRYDLSAYNVLIDKPLDVREGDLYVPATPGLGIELDAELLAAHEVGPDQAAR